MPALDCIWNHQISGLPMATLIAMRVAINRAMGHINTTLWRGNLADLGAASIIQNGVTIRHPSRVSIGARCSVGAGTSMTSEHPDSRLIIGNDVILNPMSHLDFSGNLTIEADCVISKRVMIFTHSHGHSPKSKSTKTPLVIESGAWLGSNVIVCENVTRIAAGTIIAAGAVVTKCISTRGVYAGIPARLVSREVRNATP